MKFSYQIFTLLSCIIVLASCTKETPEVQPDTEFSIQLSTSYAVPGIDGRSETGTADLKLYEDNSLKFVIQIDNLNASDVLTAAHIHEGGLLSTGGVFLGLVDGQDIVFEGNKAEGTLMLTDEQVTRLKGQEDLYINVHSVDAPPGLLRGQMGIKIDQAYNVPLTSSVDGRQETGYAYLRLVNGELKHMFIINDLSSSDQVVASHIHKGATGENGDVLIGLSLLDNDQIGKAQSVTIDESQEDGLATQALYINVHSFEAQPGLMRGQIRD